ncbi:immunoglobulin gamma-1 heavy chain-like isoform X2 [Nerophis ophidion]|uniref:immunoglobulin gamma-1 heavy chain-like isoform X2 n=1 Tax=Nerophis ophidion TaxID=159077 RepID=UPI002ADF30BB|nr:immunoglobulin gamma-1 heavy chain-like isoform X2 [Nerophis ophidion]
MWIVLHLLLLLQSGECAVAYTFSTKTVGPGQSVSLTCTVGSTTNVQYVFWIRFVSGISPEVLKSTSFHSSGPLTSNTGHRFTGKKEQETIVLQISQVEKSDTAIYYCFRVRLDQLVILKGTFLQVTEPEPSVSVVSEVRPGPPVKLQCSVLSHSGNDICQDGHKVSWFRTGPESVHPSFVYGECKIKDNSTQKCVHTFKKNINSSDAGTYLCAVVTCGRIFMGNPTKVNIEDSSSCDSYKIKNSSSCDSYKYVIFVLSAALALGFFMSAFLINKIRTNNCFCCKAGPQTLDETFSRSQQENWQIEADKYEGSRGIQHVH